MKIFSRKPTIDESPAVTVPTAEDTAGRLRTCEHNLSTISARSHEAAASFERAAAKHQAACTAYDAAVEAYQDEPTAARTKGIREARDAKELAEIELARPQRALADARAAQVAAEEAVEATKAQLEREEKERRISAALLASSPSTYHVTTRPLWEMFIRARLQMHDALDQIVLEFEKANGVARGLIAEGVDAPTLRTYQVVAEYCAIAVEAEPQLAAGFVHGLQFGENGLSAGFNDDNYAQLRESLEHFVVDRKYGHAGRLDAPGIDKVGRSMRWEPIVPLDTFRDFFADTIGGYVARREAEAAAVREAARLELEEREQEEARAKKQARLELKDPG